MAFATDALEGAGLAAAGLLFVVGVLFLGMSVLTETSGVFWAGVGLVILSLSSFSLFAIGSESYVAAAGDGDRRVVVGFVES